MSAELKKSNAMLLRISYFQFLGTVTIIACPVATITFTYWFASQPSFFVNYCLAFMNFFGFYDVLITLICIRPYRMYTIDLFRILVCKKKYKVVVIPSIGFQSAG